MRDQTENFVVSQCLSIVFESDGVSYLCYTFRASRSTVENFTTFLEDLTKNVRSVIVCLLNTRDSMLLGATIVQGTEEYVSLDAVLNLLGLTSEEYEAQKEASCLDIDLPDRVRHVIARFSNRGAGLSPSSYDVEAVRELLDHCVQAKLPH